MNRRLARLFARLFAVASCVFAIGTACADEILIDGPDESHPSEKCVSVSRIDTTRVLDDRNVLFFMRGGKIYRNFLPRRCPGLSRRDAFSYRTSSSRLCDVDTITLLQLAGSGFIPGPSCGLGKFYPVTEQEAEALEGEVERARELGLGDLE